MTEKEFIERIGKLATADMQKSGVLASVTVAQACLESGYGTTDLAVKANNLFGMKCQLSGNTWKSVWDGKSKYTKTTQEEYKPGVITNVKADFRKYPSIEKSINDHSLYLTGAKNGSKLRYEGLAGEKNYRKAIQIIKNGGYATDSKYVDKICNLIERWNLTRFDKQKEVKPMKIINAVSSSKVPKWGNQKKFIAVHYLGVVGQNHDLQSGGYGAHYYIYWDGTIYQRCSHDAIVWQVGTGGYYAQKHPQARNSNTIGIEMCCKCDGDTSQAGDKWYFTKETQEACAWLVRKLMADENIPLKNVLRHYDIVSKCCPAPYVHNNKYKTSWTWDEFKARVAGSEVPNTTPSETKYYRVRKSWNDEKSQIGAYTSLDNAIKACKSGYKVFDDSGKQVYPETPNSDSKPSTGSQNDIVKAGQVHANNFCGAGIATDGIRGAATKKAGIKVLQTAMNLDYKAGLKVDGLWGTKTSNALKGHTVHKGEKQYMVTALEILLMLKGYNANGVESPGVFGSGLQTAVKDYQKDHGLSVDGIAGYNTFKSLIG